MYTPFACCFGNFGEICEYDNYITIIYCIIVKKGYINEYLGVFLLKRELELFFDY